MRATASQARAFWQARHPSAGSHPHFVGPLLCPPMAHWGMPSYDIGTGHGHVAIQVDDIRQACDDVAARGGRITYGPALHGGKTWIAFVADPDGYKIELIQR